MSSSWSSLPWQSGDCFPHCPSLPVISESRQHSGIMVHACALQQKGHWFNHQSVHSGLSTYSSQKHAFRSRILSRLLMSVLDPELSSPALFWTDLVTSIRTLGFLLLGRGEWGVKAPCCSLQLAWEYLGNSSEEWWREGQTGLLCLDCCPRDPLSGCSKTWTDVFLWTFFDYKKPPLIMYEV